MDLKKIKVIVNWQEPKNVKDVRAFIGVGTNLMV